MALAPRPAPRVSAMAIAAVVWAVLMVMGGSLIHLTERRHDDRQRMTTYTIAARAAITLEHQLSRSLSSTYALASWVQKHGGHTGGFEDLAASLIYLHDGITSLQLVSSDAIVRSYPTRSSAAADRVFLSRLSAPDPVSSGVHLHLLGPVADSSGGSDILGYVPIYLASRARRSEHFWGYSVVHIALPRLLRASNLDAIFSPNYNFVLSEMRPSGDVRELAGTGGVTLRDPVSIEVTTPGGAWVLSTAPKGGWTRSVSTFGWVLLIALSLLAASGAYVLMWRQSMAAASALYDPLTGLPNRLLFQERATLAIEQAKRNDSHAAVLFLDLDNFKPVNDAMGHGTGDRLLRESAQRLKSSLRTVDTIARVGGDEFLVVLTNLKNQHYAEAIATQLIDELEKPFRIDGREARIGVSIGISLFPRDGTRLSDLVARADAAMYRAKRQGGGSYQAAPTPDTGAPLSGYQTENT